MIEFDQGFMRTDSFILSWDTTFQYGLIGNFDFIITDCCVEYLSSEPKIKLNMDIQFPTGNVYKHFEHFSLLGVTPNGGNGFLRYLSLLKSIGLLSQTDNISVMCEQIMFSDSVFINKIGHCSLERCIMDNPSGDLVCTYDIKQFL